MKANYRRNNFFGPAKWYVLTGAFFALVLFFIFFGSVLERPVRSSIFRFLSPLFGMSTSIKSSLDGVVYFFFDKERLGVENENLREMVANLKGNIERSEILARENEELKTALGWMPQKKIFARVLFAPPVSAYNFFVIDVGSEAGAAEGLAVLTSGGVYLGTISEAFPRQSKVALSSYYGKETGVYFETSGAPAVATGIGGEMLRIVVPESVPGLAVGERVLTSSGEPQLVGFVERIDGRRADALQNVYLRLPLNIFEIHSVFVIQ